jgi:hypothetical protein
MLAASTLAGMFFPFCKSGWTWSLNMAVSWILFCAIFALLYQRATRYYAVKKNMQANAKDRSSTTSSEYSDETFEIIRSSFSLSLVCTTTWTFLALSFTLMCLAPTYAPANSIWASPTLPTIITAFFEVASKIWYLNALIDTYDRIFDEKSRAMRRLEQLRTFMSAVWESSSDVIVFAGEQCGRVSARVSPAYLDMVGLSTGRMSFLNRGDVSLVLEIFPDEGVFHVFAMDLCKKVTRDDAVRFKDTLTTHKLSSKMEGLTTEQKNLAIMANLALKACRVGVTNKVTSLTQDL